MSNLPTGVVFTVMQDFHKKSNVIIFISCLLLLGLFVPPLYAPPT